MLLSLAIATAIGVPSILGFSQQALAQSPSEAFIENLGDRTLGALQDDTLDSDAKRGALREIFLEGINIQAIGAFAMGRYWNQMDTALQIEYLQLVEEFMITTYTRRFLDFSGEQFSVLGSRGISDTDDLVSTRIFRPNSAEPIDVQWHVRAYDDGTHKIVDVIIENSRQALTWQQEFGSLIRSNGGDVTSVLDSIREMLAREQ